MRKQCEAPSCGKTFDAKRAAARFCSATCRKRNQRRPDKPRKDATVISIVDLTRGDVELRPDDDDVPGPRIEEAPLTAATRKQLVAAGRLDTALGQAALLAAVRLDMVGMAETGSGVKALLDAHRTALAEAVKNAETQDNPLQKIRQSAALKMVHGGRS